MAGWVHGRSDRRWLLVVGLATMSSIPPCVGFWTGSLVGGILAAVLGLVVAWVAVRWREEESIVLAMVPATFLAGSGLLPGSTYFLAPATLSIALLGACGFLALTRRREIASPPRWLMVVAALYLFGMAIATVFSIRPQLSVGYFIGTAVILLVSIWISPALLSKRESSTRFLLAIGATGAAGAIMGLITALTGPVLWFGRPLGFYTVNELTINGQTTGITILRDSGPFLAPGGAALVLGIATTAFLGVLPRYRGSARYVLTASLVAVIVALVFTMSRTGWIVSIVGALVLGLADLSQRRWRPGPWIVAVGVGALFVALLVNVVGADYRPDQTAALANRIIDPVAAITGGAAPSPPAIPVAGGVSSGDTNTDDLVQSRGGDDVGARLELWRASVQAIRDSPIVGYGPGTNAFALDPYLQGVSRRLVGLTSHNTLLRTWIESGIAGAAGFVAFAVIVLALGGVRILRDRWNDPGFVALYAIFVSLLAGQAFESLLLGGVILPSYAWAAAGGLLALSASAPRMDGARKQAHIAPP
jgi:hypothetical protein